MQIILSFSVVFEKDSLSFHCQVDVSQPNTIQWLVNDNPLSEHSPNVVQITNPNHGILTFSKLEAAFKGVVTCATSNGANASVDVLVLTENIPICQPITLDTSRGQYKWGAAIGGNTLSQWCQRRTNHYEIAEASLNCRHTGEWAATVNVSQCAYTSNVTDTLHKFATMNDSFDMGTLLQSAKHFLNYTSDPRTFQNPMDVVYFSQAVENYLPYLSQSNDVGHYMMDMMGNILGVAPKLLSDAQKHGLACRRLLNVLDNITAVAVPAFQHRSEHLAMDTHFLKPMNNFEGSGMSCTWYNTNQKTALFSKKTFYCATGMMPLEIKSSQILVSVVVPKSLYTQIDYQPMSYPYGTSTGNY